MTKSRAGERTQASAPSALITEQDLYLFNEGSHFRLHDRLGAHLATLGGVEGTFFAVWAPNARRVTVMGEWNGWNKTADALSPRGSSGIWERFMPGVGKGSAYKYHIVNRDSGFEVDKADPVGFLCEAPPKTASVVWDLEYAWGDGDWMRDRAGRNRAGAPLSIYELHPGSWRRVPGDGNRSLNYRELAPLLAEHVVKLGFTHVEMMPVMEHPFFGSWGYQVTGYFAPSSRYGTPQDFMYLIDVLHQAGIGVILDWVPSHFPADEHGLAYFDGTHLYEHADPRQGFHPDWKSSIFNFSRHEVRSFLISNALFWLSAYHADGLRVDAVASMLYLDYGRNEGEWIPNAHGGRENLDALVFLRRLNEEVYRSHPDVQTIAEESTSWPMVSRPTYVGGLGFGMKWDMGWMHDTLHYFSIDPVYRKFHHNEMTFRGLYAFHENFVLPLSHDEVVYGKGSLLNKMAGDPWQKFANLRALYCYMFAQPGKKLIFMGCEFAQWSEWNHDGSLDWHLVDDERHGGMQRLVADLNRVYRDEAALHDLDFDPAGYEWIDANDSGQSCFTFLRKSGAGEIVLAALNLTPVPRANYRAGVPKDGFWKEILNSDAKIYGGSGHGNMGGVHAAPVPSHGHGQSLTLTLPPLGAVFLKCEG